jgi:hypothetical protein
MKGSLGTHAEEMKNLFADMEATGKAMDEEEKIFYFLESLCPSLENVKTLLETNIENLTFQSCVYKLQDHVNRQELKMKSEVPKVLAVTKALFHMQESGPHKK